MLHNRRELIKVPHPDPILYKPLVLDDAVIKMIRYAQPPDEFDFRTLSRNAKEGEDRLVCKKTRHTRSYQDLVRKFVHELIFLRLIAFRTSVFSAFRGNIAEWTQNCRYQVTGTIIFIVNANEHTKLNVFLKVFYFNGIQRSRLCHKSTSRAHGGLACNDVQLA